MAVSRRPLVAAAAGTLILIFLLTFNGSLTTDVDGVKHENIFFGRALDSIITRADESASANPVTNPVSAVPSYAKELQQYVDSDLPTVAIFLGTRPEAIKCAPLVAEMRAPHNAAVFNTAVVSTGQHREMLQQMFDSFHLSVDIELSLMVPDQTPADLMARALTHVTAVLTALHPAMVIVQGDTATALVCAMAAFFMRIPVAHVEAGLRSFDFDNPFPEEFNRRAIDILAAFHFAPTEYAAEALRRENICGREIHVTGNTGVDAILHALAQPVPPSAKEIIDRIARIDPGGVVMLVTSHRRENLGAPLASICRAVRRVVEESHRVTVVFPVHLNPNVRKVVHTLLRNLERVVLLEPLSYDILPFVMQRADLVMTDSGGIQEEAVSIGKPVILLRKTTERPEGVFVGTVRISGTDEGELYGLASGAISRIAAIKQVLQAQRVFGYGNASQITAGVLRDYFARTPEEKAEVVSGCTATKQAELARAVYGADAASHNGGSAGGWAVESRDRDLAAAVDRTEERANESLDMSVGKAKGREVDDRPSTPSPVHADAASAAGGVNAVAGADDVKDESETGV